ncbi:MAG: thioredoxin family protein [Ignavibacteria bacterium]|nr:thioredoxin family protein [Ignavibacteria bacterium]
MQIDLPDFENFSSFIQTNKASLVYFSTPDCNVCKVLKPKVMELLADDFKSFVFGYVNCDTNIVTAAQNSVFSVPTLIVYVEGKGVLRKSRNIALAELNEELSRISSFL